VIQLLPPELNHLHLIGPLIVATQFVFLAFLGVALVSTVLALACKKFDPVLARDFAAVVSPRLGIWITLGILPLVALALLYGQLLHGSRYQMLDSLVLLLPLAGMALAALWLYRHGGSQFIGAAGVLATLGFVAPFINLLELVQRPEQWPLVNPLLPDLYHVEPLIRILLFVAGSLLATGGALLGVYFVWPEGKLADDLPHRQMVRTTALVLTLVGAMLAPALMIWDMAMPPWGVGTIKTVKVAGPVLVVLWVTALIAVGLLFRPASTRGFAVLSVLALAGVALEVNRQHAVAEYAISDQLAVVRMKALSVEAGRREVQEARYPSNTPLDAKAGERIYAEKCASCHAFDVKVVGPAHKDVLPKYRGQKDTLAAFILNPQKVDPAYPAMPKLGLSRREAVAVAEHLLGKFEGVPPTTEVKP
jgi:cytochrome c551/c552